MQLYPGVMSRQAGTLTALLPPVGSSSNRNHSGVFSPLLNEVDEGAVYERPDNKV